MLTKIVTYPAPVLNAPAQLVTEFGEKLVRTVEEMYRVMWNAPAAIGLAAPQIGVSQQIAVIDLSRSADENQRLLLVNPVILQHEGKRFTGEGCLSVPGVRAKVKRWERIRFRAQDWLGNWHDGSAEGLLAHCIQHEFDHLNGILFTSRISDKANADWKVKMARMKAKAA